MKAETGARKPVKKPFLSPVEQYQGPELWQWQGDGFRRPRSEEKNTINY